MQNNMGNEYAFMEALKRLRVVEQIEINSRDDR
jgi:hypothetical protein